MATALGSDIPLGRLGMVMPRGMLGKLGKVGRLGMVMPLGKLGGLTPLGRELSKAGMVTPRGMLGNLGRVPGISVATRPIRWKRGSSRPEEEEDVMVGRWSFLTEQSEGEEVKVEEVRGGKRRKPIPSCLHLLPPHIPLSLNPFRSTPAALNMYNKLYSHGVKTERYYSALSERPSVHITDRPLEASRGL